MSSPTLRSPQPLLIVSILTVMLLAAMDAMITSTILPTVIASIGGLELYPWMVSIFMLSQMVTTPIYGKLSDLYGHKRFILLAIAVFLMGSVLCGAAQTMPQLIAARALQGVGGGGLVTMSFIMFGVLFPPEQRGRMQGLLSSMWAIASIAGPIVGAFFAATLSWRWAFYINLPIGLAAALLIATYLQAPERPAIEQAIDGWGAALFAVAGFGLMAGLLEFQPAAWSWQQTGLLGMGLAGTLLFVWHERRTVEPLLPIPLFKDPVFTVSMALNLIVAAGFFSSMNFIPLFVQGVSEGSAAQAGRVLTIVSLGWVASSWICGRLVNRWGLRLFCVLGAALMGISFAVLSQGAPTGLWQYLAVAPMGLGMGAIVTCTLLAVQSAAPRTMLGAATSGLQLFRSIGGTLGMAVFGGLQLAQFKHTLAVEAATSPQLGSLVPQAHLILDPIGRSTLSAPVTRELARFLGHSIQHVFLLAAGLAAVAWVIAWRMPARTPAEVARPVAG